jgi:hypothetical protein
MEERLNFYVAPSPLVEVLNNSPMMSKGDRSTVVTNNSKEPYRFRLIEPRRKTLPFLISPGSQPMKTYLKALLLSLTLTSALARSYPSKPIDLVVPFPARRAVSTDLLGKGFGATTHRSIGSASGD